MRQLTRELRVGTCCGKCVPEAQAALTACVAQRGSHAMRAGNVPTPSFFPSSTVEFAT